MPIPAHVRTWQFQVNQFYQHTGTVLSTNQNLLWAIKEALKGNGSWTDKDGGAVASAGNWTVKGSSDGVGGFGNGDGVDRWAAATNLIWANPATNHSWIVLEQTGIPGAVGNLQICIDCRYTGASYNADIVTSVSAGFAGGTATARPTAADEQNLNAAVSGGASATRWGGTSGTTNSTMLHVLKTNDGKSTRIIMTRMANNGTGPHTCGYWAFELPVANSAFTTPSACIAQAVDSTAPTSEIMDSTAFGGSQVTWSRIPGGANFSSSWMSLGQVTRGEWARAWGDANTTTLNADNTEPVMSVALYSSTVNSRGKNARFVDLYQATYTTFASSAGPQGRTMPQTGTLRQWARFGEYWQPWNGTKPVVVA